ncbi:hypothetical protein OKW33_006407 [Paraburkholderia atlantica]|uniref:Uncharacterized protein n=1 Tax=Paraburkholderia atlantica TaxID=2654982 RepID=A0A7W8QFW8_PARAM|nr:hypothetical protein [Paraburkholderia atlantica]
MDLWDFGQSDVRYSIAHPEWPSAMEVAPGIHIYDLPPCNGMVTPSPQQEYSAGIPWEICHAKRHIGRY